MSYWIIHKWRVMMKPMLNLGCGRVILPLPIADRPIHHALVDESIFEYPTWVNVDKNPEVGVDVCLDLFRYPWDFDDNAFNGALLSHVCEHIPHMVHPDDHRRFQEMQDGWYAFFSELHRVLTHGAMVHCLSPYGHGSDAISDPSHTRYLNEYHFRHSMQPNPEAPFKYNHQLHFDIVVQDVYRPTPDFACPPYFMDGQVTDAFWKAKRMYNNVIQDFYVRLICIKDE